MKTAVKKQNHRNKSQPGPFLQRKGKAAQAEELPFISRKHTQGIKPKLTISQPGDKYEQEADRVADEVMRMPSPMTTGDPVVAGSTGLGNQLGNGSLFIQRMCTNCAMHEGDTLQRKPFSDNTSVLPQISDLNRPVAARFSLPKQQSAIQRQEDLETDEDLIQAKTSVGTTPQVTPAINANIQSLQGGGRPLSRSECSFFEPRFRVDFNQLRVHTDPHAAEMAKSINARAFTVGRNIVFGRGQYAPESKAGKRLMAHELTHVVQQVGRDLLTGVSNHSRPDNSIVQRKINPKTKDTFQLLKLLTDLSLEVKKAILKGENKWIYPLPALQSVIKLDDYIKEKGVDDKNPREYVSHEIRRISEEMWNDFLDHVDKKRGIAGLSEGERNAYKNAIKNLETTKEEFQKAKKYEDYVQYFGALKIALADPYFFYYHVVYRQFTPIHINAINQLGVLRDPSILHSRKDMKRQAGFYKKFKGEHLVYLSIETDIYRHLAKQIGLNARELKEKLLYSIKLPVKKSGLKKMRRFGKQTKKVGESFSDFRKNRMKGKYRKLFKKLPQWIREKGKGEFEVIALLDRMAAMDPDERAEFLRFLEGRGKFEPKQKDNSEPAVKKGQNDDENQRDQQIEPNQPDNQKREASQKQTSTENHNPDATIVLMEEFEMLKKFREIARKTGQALDEDKLAKFLSQLKKFSLEEREALYQFIAENSENVAAKQGDIEDLIEQFHKFTPAQIEQKRLSKLFSETVDEKKFTKEDIKKAEFSINTTLEQQKNTRDAAQRSNDNISQIKRNITAALQNLEGNETLAKEVNELKPFDPDDFEISLEMLIVKGILLGAGKMSIDEIEPEGQKLASQIDDIPRLIADLIWDIEKELALHLATSLIPVAGWVKAGLTVVRVGKLVKRMNQLRKILKKVKKTHNIYLKIKQGIETAQTVFGQAERFIRDFETHKNTLKSLQNKLEDLEATDSVDEQVELIFDELMEKMVSKMDALAPFFEKFYIPEEAIDDPEKLIEILFNIPVGVREFSKLNELYSNAGDKGNDLEYQQFVFYKSIAVGAMLYPFVGFMIDVIGSTLSNLASEMGSKLSGGVPGFKNKKRNRKNKKGIFRGLWARGYVYKYGRKNNPELEKHLRDAYKILITEFPETPESSKWDLGLRLSLRLKLRKFIKVQNKLNRKVQGHLKKEKNAKEYVSVPIPKFKYTLGRKPKDGYFDITLKLNPKKKHRVPSFTVKRFNKGIKVSNFGSSEARALRKWLENHDYKFAQLRGGGWHIRRRNHLTNKRGLPYLIVRGNMITTGLSGKDVTIVDKLISSNDKIISSSLVPEGYYVARDGRKLKGKLHHRYYFLKKKRNADKLGLVDLYIDESGKLQKGSKEKHISRFVIIKGGKYMLKYKYRSFSKNIRSVFYAKDYIKAIKDKKNEMLNKPRSKGGLRHETVKNLYYYYESPISKKYFKKNVKPGHPEYPTLDHEPSVVIHWNSKGRNRNQRFRKDFYNFKYISNKEFIKLIMPWRYNSSKGGGSVFNFIVGVNFRGPKEDNK